MTLHNAAKSNSLKLTNFLINNLKEDIIKMDYDGNTALYYALKNNSDILAEVLVRNGANVLGKNSDDGMQEKYSVIVTQGLIDLEVSIGSDIHSDVESLGSPNNNSSNKIGSIDNTNWVNKVSNKNNTTKHIY
ncbi:MAG: ankyrin repeat domain-containing protein [Candidatus Midichloriaceae bacterium]